MSPPDLESPTVGPRWGVVLVGAGLGFVVGELVATVLAAVGVSLAHYPGGLSSLARATQAPWWFSAVSLAGLWVGFGLAARVARTRGHLAPLAEQWRVRLADLRFVVLGVALQFAVNLAYAPWHVQHLNQPANRLLGGASGLGGALIVGMTLLGAPIMEEVFFRGVIFRGLAGLVRAPQRGVRMWAAAVVSGLLFALAHGEPVQFAGLAAVGVVLAVLVARTQRLTPSVITHASFNAVALAALYASRGH